MEMVLKNLVMSIFFKKFETLRGAAILIGSFSLLSKVLGLVRDKLLAHIFGAGDILDAYYAAFRLPDLIFNLLVLGALTAGFIPVYLEARQKSKGDADELASSVFNILLLGLSVLALAVFGFAPALMKIIVPGFSPEKQALAVTFTRIMAFSPLFLGLSSLFGGILQSRKRFLGYSLAPVLYNFGIILGAVFLVKFFGANGLAAGVVLGAFLHMVAQWIIAGRLGFKIRLGHVISSEVKKNTNKIFKLMLPRVLGTAISQFNLFIVTTFASGLALGSLAVYNFASNLAMLPVDLFGVSYAVAIFPILGENAARGDIKKIITDVSNSIARVLFFIIPSTIIFLLLRAQIVRVVLGSGKFDWTATIKTADTLAFFALSMFASALIPLLVRVFYALQDTKTPLIAALVSVVANIFFAAAFKNIFGVPGLSAAFSLSTALNFVLLYGLLKLRLGHLHESEILPSIFKMSGAALVMAVVIQILKYPLAEALDMNTFLGIFLHGVIAGTAGLVVYIGINWILKTKELRDFKFRISPSNK